MYEYSIVSDNLSATLFVLARDPVTFAVNYDAKVQSLLQSFGFTHFYNSPIAITQDGCTYPPSPPSSEDKYFIRTN